MPILVGPRRSQRRGEVERPTYAPRMNFRGRFVGTLHLPEKGLGEDRTPVGLADGELVATIRWYVMTSRFQIPRPEQHNRGGAQEGPIP